ncbi:MAG: hypothetical protein CME13_14665 [Gemmatimonadetes bacterium]|nr:hypothetical protein [Gemmatimonadota bacterium]
MTDTINSEVLHHARPPSSDSTSREVLPGEIDGFRTVSHALVPGATVELAGPAEKGRGYLFRSGRGRVDDGDTTHPLEEVALFAPQHGTTASVTATEELLFLELIVDLTATDLTEFEQNAEKYPFFLSYSDCKTYRERIKSAKTISRTLLPEHTFPRLCVGSVETTGDDRVAAHEHPMLEQLFLGLQDNECVVQADAATAAFGEGVLLHIPLASRHGVEVHKPHRLHYIWIDLFRNREGMQWIVQEHIKES